MISSTELSAMQARCGARSRVFPTCERVIQCLLMLAAGLAAGCGAARPSKYYQLTVPGDMMPAANPNPVPITLLIGRMTGSALYREDQIVYSSGGESMGTYEYHRWAEPPTEMIAEILLRRLRASGNYRGVYTLRSDVHGDFLLHGRLYDFKEVSGSSEVARVTMELELRNIKAGTTVWTHFYTHDEPASGKDVSMVVAALDKNVQQGIAECRASLDQYFAAHPPASPAQAAP
ncbi:MAG TPA: ABC-type transport auxiliary lipoprotein family protein [Candidatus Acidoferrum sp.]|nr:ABC-type transport auxiliary lipoprotein family protein [Candidatus Acidoferrum sp.]